MYAINVGFMRPVVLSATIPPATDEYPLEGVPVATITNPETGEVVSGVLEVIPDPAFTDNKHFFVKALTVGTVPLHVAWKADANLDPNVTDLIEAAEDFASIPLQATVLGLTVGDQVPIPPVGETFRRR